MDQKLFIANWKSHKNPEEVKAFLAELQASRGEINWDNKKVIIAPPYPLLDKLLSEIKISGLPIEVSSQDMSAFEEGAYTGEVAGSLIGTYAKFVIIGHSERRELLHETEELLRAKVGQAIASKLTPIFCVQNETQEVPVGVNIVAFEPPSAIGTGNPDEPSHIAEVFEKIQASYSQVTVLYGGSVTPENIARFLEIPSLGGFLVGGASLEAQSFISLLRKW